MPSSLPLESVNVLDLSRDVAGAYCTKLLADLGATVLMAEPPGGHPARAEGPFAGGVPHAEKSGLFIYLASNKRSVAIDLETAAGRDRVAALAADADLVVESLAPGQLDALGLGYDRLSAGHDDLVMTSVTPFGQYGPYRDWQSEEIVGWALSGYLYFGGDPEREPLMVHNRQADLHGGAHGALGALGALWWARRTGQGQYVDVSSFEAMLTAHIWTTTMWTQLGAVMERTGSDVVKCRDGWIHILSMAASPELFVMIGKPEMMDAPRFQDRASWMAAQPEIQGLIREWCLGQNKEDVWRLGQDLRIPCAPVYDASDLAGSEHLKERGFWWEIDHPEAGKVVVPGAPYVLDGETLKAREPAPRIGEHAEGWPADRRGRSPAPKITAFHSPIEPDPKPEMPLPLQGVRIIEVTNNWAGPVAGRNLGDMGAEIIKVESPQRIAARQGHYTGNQPFRYHWNRVSYNCKMNRSKYGVTPDLSMPEGRDLFLELVKDADIVIENNSPRVMRNLNLTYDVLREVNPRLIMLQIAAYGQTGPNTDYIAYGANIEAASGLASVTGYADDERPYRTGYFYADPVTATHASAAILAALHRREQTGEGMYIDLSLQENGISFLPQSMIEYNLTERLPERRGNRHSVHAPQGVYRTIGDDMWLSLCVRSDDDWRSLADTIGDDRLRDERYANEESRRAHHDEIDAVISEWSLKYDHNEASAILQEAGIPAAPVLMNWEMVSNLHAYARDFYVIVPQRSMGAWPYPGITWHFSKTPTEVRLSAPDFGEHNCLVFGDYLGLSADQLDDFYDRRVMAEQPPDEFLPPPPAYRP